MSYPRFESGPAPSQEDNRRPTQDEIDDVSKERALEALERALARLTRDVASDWRHCGKAACRRSRRCRGFACAPKVRGDD